MKKFLSLLLAAMMLLSCASAMAENGENNTVTNPVADTKNGAEVTIYGDYTSHYGTKNDATGAVDSANSSVNTEVWLQVEADGQIDVTVPLVLVFKTDIDGGDATSPAEYKMKNNGTADIAVTSIKVSPAGENESSQPMAFKKYDEVTGVDTYGLKLYVAATSEDTANHRKAHAAYYKDMYDYQSDADTADVMDGGLFQVYKPSTSTTTNAEGKTETTTTAGETQIVAQLKTSPLSFTTARNAGENGAASTLNTNSGIQIITITYTVGIDAGNAIGDPITSANEEFKEPAPVVQP